MDPRLAAALRKTACPGPGPQCRSDPIELSNACRAFYNSRLESARVLRERWSRSGSESYQKTGEGTAGAGSDKNENCRKKSSIDIAMDTLRQEMASLMEQDLSLMRQLLTLNEEIEELKWRRRYCWSRASSSAMTSSGDVDLGSLASFTSSEASLGWWQESGDLLTKYPGISSLSLHADHARLSVYDEEDPMGTFNRHVARSKGSQRTLSAMGGNQTFQQQQQQQQQQTLDENRTFQQQQQQLQQQQQTLDENRTFQQQQQIQQQQQQQQQQQTLGENQMFQQQQQQLQQQQQQQIQSRTGWGRGEEKESEKEYAERESFDSGIHEGYTDTSLHTNSTTEVTHM